MKNFRKIGLASLMVILLAGSLSGCGKRSAPVAPSAVPLTDEEKNAGVVREKKKPGKRFILDGLLE